MYLHLIQEDKNGKLLHVGLRKVDTRELHLHSAMAEIQAQGERVAPPDQVTLGYLGLEDDTGSVKVYQVGRVARCMHPVYLSPTFGTASDRRIEVAQLCLERSSHVNSSNSPVV